MSFNINTFQENLSSNGYIIDELSGYTSVADSYLQPIYFGNNLATGHTVFHSKSGRTLNFRRIVAGLNTSITSDATSITISSVGGSFTGATLYLLKTSFNTYSGTTAPGQFANKALVNTYTGTTAPATFANKILVQTYTGLTNTAISNKLNSSIYSTYTATTAPATFANKALVNTYTGTTAPATYANKALVNTYTGTTAPATFANKVLVQTYTGLTNTALNNRVLKAVFSTYTGTTVPAALSLKVDKTVFSTYTGTTAPGQFANKILVNTYTGLTNTAINSKLNTTIHSTYTGTTAPNTYVNKPVFSVYTGSTVPTALGLKVNKTLFDTYTGQTISSETPQKEVSTSTYIVQSTDRNYAIYFTHTGGTLVLIKNLATNFEFTGVRKEGAGTVTFSGTTTGSTINLKTIDNLLTIGREKGAVSWIQKTSTQWYGFGALGTGLTSSIIGGVSPATIYAYTATTAAVIATKAPKVIGLAASDETTAITTGTSKVIFRMPYAMTLTEVRASLGVAQTSGTTFTVDINKNGTTVLSTKLTINNTHKTSKTASIPAVISVSSLADDDEITVDVDAKGSGTAKGLKVWLIGT